MCDLCVFSLLKHKERIWCEEKRPWAETFFASTLILDVQPSELRKIMSFVEDTQSLALCHGKLELTNTPGVTSESSGVWGMKMSMCFE